TVLVLAPAGTKLVIAVSFSRLNVTRVPSGAGPKPVTASPPGAPAGRPSSWETVAVTTCCWPSGLVASSGLSSILASTKRLVAGPLLGDTPFVEAERTGLVGRLNV